MTETIDHGAARQNTSTRVPAAPARFVGPEEDGADGLPFKTWTREEAEALRAKQPPLSPWWVVAAQAVAGLLCLVLALVLFRRADVAWSVLYGAAATVLPAALLARGMTRGTKGAVASAAGFMFWEMLKIGAAIAMLVIAARVVPNLNWPALLVTMVVCIKVNWVALLWHPGRMNYEASNRHGS